MTVWVIKGGESGQLEDRMLNHGLIACSSPKLGDFGNCQTREELEALYRLAYPDAENKRVSSHVGQLFAFLRAVQPDDLVVLPRKKRGLAIGKIQGYYSYRSDLGQDFTHTRSVDWLRRDVPRNLFDKDLLYSFGALLAFCRADRRDAEERIRKVIDAYAGE